VFKVSHIKNAAGTLSFLISAALPKLVYTPNDDEVPLDLTQAFVKSLEMFMLAQAQECVWQKAIMDGTSSDSK
jgi:programmed cell death 6-interacting protein